MEIAALAMLMNHTELMRDVSLATTKKRWSFRQGNAEQALEVIDTSHSVLGQTTDICV